MNSFGTYPECLPGASHVAGTGDTVGSTHNPPALMELPSSFIITTSLFKTTRLTGFTSSENVGSNVLFSIVGYFGAEKQIVLV